MSLKYLINKQCQSHATLKSFSDSRLIQSPRVKYTCVFCYYRFSLRFLFLHRFFPIALHNKEVKEILAFLVFHRRFFVIQLNNKAINLYDHMTRIRQTVGTLLICTMNPLMILNNFAVLTEPVITVKFCMRFCIGV